MTGRWGDEVTWRLEEEMRRRIDDEVTGRRGDWKKRLGGELSYWMKDLTHKLLNCSKIFKLLLFL